tara:strand:- start:333 stop:857 length:525 start_codon:yes stop_codon:yes gene_type:complete
MPSYYDSTKKKPGKAKTKYKKGGIVKMQEGRQAPNSSPSLTANQQTLADAKAEIAKQRETENRSAIESQIKKEQIAQARYDQVYRKWVDRYAARSIKGETARDHRDKVGDWARRNIGERFGVSGVTSADDKAQMQARKDVLGFKKGGKVKKTGKSVKVRGMGAATRGGNFTRNG